MTAAGTFRPPRRLGAFARRGAALGLLAGMPLLQAAPHEYRHIEGEAYSATEGSGLRKEGFTSWMAHPSHGAVMVLGGPGNWLEYEVKALAPRPYHLFIRGLAWATGCDVEVYWDGQKIATSAYDHPATALRWSCHLGVVHGPGDHRLRLVGAPGIHQAPYLDVILLTTQEGMLPDDADQDFASFTSLLPALALQDDAGLRCVLPRPDPDAAGGPVEVQSVRCGPLRFGQNEVRVTLAAAEATRVTVEAALGEGPLTSVAVDLAGQGAPAEALVALTAAQSGEARLRVALRTGERLLAGASYPVRIPAPVRVRLDEHALPLGPAARAWWQADYSAATPDVIVALGAEVEVQAEATPGVLFRARLGPGAPLALGAPLAIPLGGAAAGRYQVVSRFTWQGKPALTDQRAIILFAPVSFEPWEPVRASRASGPVLLLNDKPFLGRLLFHAAPSEETRSHGFNLVQCYGGDPDPLDSIQKHLDLCSRNGLWGTVALFNNRFFLPGPGFDRGHLRQAVIRFREHPALFGWDLIDEPDGRDDMTPAEVAECARLVRETDPNHIVWVNLCRPDRALAWLESQDLWSYDAYPFPVQGFAGYKPWLEASDAGLRGKRPLGTCLQTWQWSADSTLPMPTPDMLRASAWLHILHGYTWFGTYSYFDPEPAGCLARDPELWSYCRALNSELVAMAGLILDPAPFVALAVEGGAGEVEAGMKESGGERTAVVVSGAREPRQVRVALPGNATEAEVRFDRPQRLPVTGGTLTLGLRAYGTVVLRVR